MPVFNCRYQKQTSGARIRLQSQRTGSKPGRANMIYGQAWTRAKPDSHPSTAMETH